MLEILRILAFIVGASMVSAVIFSAVKTFVLPRAAINKISRFVFLTVRRVFDFLTNRAKSYERRDAIMALYAPTALLVLPLVWLVITHVGYMFMFWALGVNDPYLDFSVSGSSLFTLGFTPTNDFFTTIVAFSEALIGLALLALLISYLPTMYGSFSRRELAVSMLEVRAGSPPSPLELILRYYRIQGLDRLTPLWEQWETWFVDIEESHTSLAPLSFFRSPQPQRSWIVAAGTILDSAALCVSTLEIPRNYQAQLCMRAGFLSLRQIAKMFRIPFHPDPHYPEQPISLTRDQFDAVYDQLAAEGVPLKPDRDQCWQDFAGWRVNYDTVLLALAGLTAAPGAPWLPEQKRPRARN